MPESEGVVRQFGSSAHGFVSDSGPAVRTLADELIAGVVRAAPSTVAPPPPFNEVSCTHYPSGRGHITAHHDPVDDVGLIAIATLAGSTRFRVWLADNPTEYTVEAGDLVLLRSHAWPTAAHRCPTHEALPPAAGDRTIMTLRSNSNGTGGGYSV